TGHKAMRSSHAASPIFLSSRRPPLPAYLLDTPGAAPYVQTFRTSEVSMLDQYRRDYAEFNAAVLREHYLFGSGHKTILELALLYVRFSDLFSRDAIHRLKQHLDETSAHFETGLAPPRHLLNFAVEHLLEDT